MDKPGEAYVDVGRYGTHFEVWEDAGDCFDRAIASIVEAVVTGAYEEWVKLGRGDKLIAAKGVFHDSEGRRRTVMNNTLIPLVSRRPGWRHVAHSPY